MAKKNSNLNNYVGISKPKYVKKSLQWVVTDVNGKKQDQFWFATLEEAIKFIKERDGA